MLNIFVIKKWQNLYTTGWDNFEAKLRKVLYD